MNNIFVLVLVCLILYYATMNKTEPMDETVFLNKNYSVKPKIKISKDTFAENYWDFADTINMSSNYEEDGVDRMNEILLGDGLKQYKGKTIAEVYDHIAGGSC